MAKRNETASNSLFSNAASKPRKTAKDKTMKQTVETAAVETAAEATAAVETAAVETAAEATAAVETAAEATAKKEMKMCVVSIKALCSLLDRKTVMPSEIIQTALLELCGKNTRAIHALAYHGNIYETMIKRIIDNGEAMTLAIPMAYHAWDVHSMESVERNILNILTPFKKQNQWTCGAAEARNAPTTWAIAQGAFFEVENGGIVLAQPTERRALKTAVKTAPNGEKVTEPTVSFQWKSKAARIRAYAAAAYQDKTALDETMMFYGCPRSVLSDLDNTEAAANTRGGGSKSGGMTKKETAEIVKNLLLSMWDDDED